MALVSVRSIWNQESGFSRAGWGILSAAWDGTFGVGDGPGLGPGWGLWEWEAETKDSSGPTAAPRRQEGLASHRWSVCPAGEGRRRLWLPNQRGAALWVGGWVGGWGADLRLG